jgi:putative transposase
VKKRYSGEQTIGFVREADAGLPIMVLLPQARGGAGYCCWRAEFGGMTVLAAQTFKRKILFSK